MAETYIQMFQEEYFPKIFSGIADETILQYVRNEAHMIEQWKSALNRYLDQIVQLQKNGLAEPVSEIIFSFLYTSLQDKSAKFRLDCYGEDGHVLGNSMLTDYVPADWLTVKLGELEERLTECVTNESLRRYIRPAEIDVLKLRAVRSLLYYFTMRFKYAIREIVDRKQLAKVVKSEAFAIQMGEYMDWQKTIFAILPEVDIFNCERSTVLQFRRFPAIHYKEKYFENLTLDQSRFLDCQFQDSQIVNCSMNDCLFDHCTFENVRVQDTQMKGCRFLKCTFKNTTFDKVAFDRPEQDEDSEYFDPVTFLRNDFSLCRFVNCQLSNGIVLNCDMQQVEIEGGCADNSDFLKSSGITWLPVSEVKQVEEQDGIF